MSPLRVTVTLASVTPERFFRLSGSLISTETSIPLVVSTSPRLMLVREISVTDFSASSEPEILMVAGSISQTAWISARAPPPSTSSTRRAPL